MILHRVFVLLIVLTSLLVLGCAGDDDDNDQADDDQVDDDQADDDQVDDDQVDKITSASPLHNSALLTEAHAGWAKADCLKCHHDVHQNAFAGGECVTCHGANGAPQRKTGHEIGDCASCHEKQHEGLSFTEQQCTACHKYEPTASCPATADYDVVVIGAGGGGLGAASLLAKSGLRVALLEKHYKVGGYMTTFRRGDYTFEASLHAMGGLDEPVDFDTLGITDRLDIIREDPIYRSIFPQHDFEIQGNVDAYKQQLKDLFPAEAAGLDALFAELQEMEIVLGAFASLEREFNLDDLATIIEHLDAGIMVIRSMFMTLQEFLTQYIHDPQLIGIWSQLVTYIGLGPSDVQALYYLSMWNSYHLGGYYYFTGGSKAVSEAMAEVVRENGGTIRLNTLVTKIVVKGGRAVQVQTQDDACYNARYVVSNANAPDTLLKMVGTENLPADYVADIEQMPLAVATLQVFLGVDHDYTDLFPGAREMFVNSTYDQDQAFEYVVDGDPNYVPFALANYTKADPTTAPAGKNVIIMSTYLPFDMGDDWHWDGTNEDYRAYKEEIAWILIERAEQYLPGLSDHIEVLEVGTPLTNWAFTLNPGGSILGFINTPEYGTKRRLPQETPIENLFLAGAWTYPGGGQSAVITSGMSAARMILKAEGR